MVILNSIIQRRDLDLRVSLSQPVCFAHYKIYFVAYFMHLSQIHKMLLRRFLAPARPLDQAFDKFILSLRSS